MASLGIRQSPRGKADGTYFRAVRQATTFELLLEETAEEGVEPFPDGLFVVTATESLLCQEINLGGEEPETEEMVEEEVV